MKLSEYLDRTGQHIPSEIFEKYKGEGKEFEEWRLIFSF